MARFFIDTEFVEAGAGSPIYLLSIGIVAEDGREYYSQLHYDKYPDVSDWVARNVLPSLRHFNMGTRGRSCVRADATSQDRVSAKCRESDCPWRGIYSIRHEVKTFCNSDTYGTPEFWGYFSDYDWVVFCQIFGSMVHLPSGWPMYCHDLKQLCDALGNPDLPEQVGAEHHALADARWNRDVWHFLNDRK